MKRAGIPFTSIPILLFCYYEDKRLRLFLLMTKILTAISSAFHSLESVQAVPQPLAYLVICKTLLNLRR